MHLKHISGLGNSRIRKLISHFGNCSSVINASKSDFKEFNFLNDEIIKQIKNVDYNKYNFYYDWCIKNNVQIMSYFDNNFPNSLKKVKNAPILIFLKGDINLLKENSVSIAGSRNSNSQALNFAFNIAKKFSEEGFIIISGGARGIDTQAHKGAIANNGKTISILGCGLMNLYPPENKPIFDEIEKKGLLLTEFFPDSIVNKYSLLSRNRITSGLGKFLILVTASVGGGTTSQSRDALAQNKNIFVPSNFLNLEPSEGLKKLILEKNAKEFNEFEDLILKLPNQKKLTLFQ